MENKRYKRALIAILILVVIGILIIAFKGVKLSIENSENTRIEIAINKQFENTEVSQLLVGIFENDEFKIEKVGAFKDSIGIVVKNTTEEQNNKVIEKLNEKYGTNLSSTDITIYVTPANTIYNIVSPYIYSTVVSVIVALAIIGIIYRKQGLTKILLNTILFTIFAEILYITCISIFNIEVSQTLIVGGIGIFIFTVIYLTKNSNKEEVTTK